MIQPVQNAKPYNPVKKAVKTAAVAAAGAGAVLYMAKTGKLNPKEGGNKVIEGIKAVLKKPADKVLQKAAPHIEKIKNNKVFENIKSSKAYTTIKDLAGNIKGEITKKVETLRDFFESKNNPEKYGLSKVIKQETYL